MKLYGLLALVLTLDRVTAAHLRGQRESVSGGQALNRTGQVRDPCPEFCTEAASYNVPICTMADFDCSACPQCAPKEQHKPPRMTYKSLKYSGGRLDVSKPRAFVDAIKSGKAKNGYCEKELTELSWKNTVTCRGPYRDIGYEVTLEFCTHFGSMWHFDFGVDFGYGGVIQLDGEQKSAFAGDIWWGTREGHANQLGFASFVSEGCHTLKAYGAEKCCDGPSRITFCANCEGYTNMAVLSSANLLLAEDHFMQVGSFTAEDTWPHFHDFSVEFESPPVVTFVCPPEVQAVTMEITSMGFAAAVNNMPEAAHEVKCTFFAIEDGVHILPDGRKIEAGSVSLPEVAGDGSSVASTNLQSDFGESPPVVLASMSSMMPAEIPTSLTVASTATEVTFARKEVEYDESAFSLSLAAKSTQAKKRHVQARRFSSTEDVTDKVGYLAFQQGEGELKCKGGDKRKYKFYLEATGVKAEFSGDCVV